MGEEESKIFLSKGLLFILGNKMMSWIVIVILVVVGIIAIKMNHLKHRVFIVLLILLALFLYSSMALVVENHSLDLKSTDGVFNAVKVYLGWLANGFQNLKTITGNVINMDWTSSDGKFFEKDNSKDDVRKTSSRR